MGGLDPDTSWQKIAPVGSLTGGVHDLPSSALSRPGRPPSTRAEGRLWRHTRRGLPVARGWSGFRNGSGNGISWLATFDTPTKLNPDDRVQDQPERYQYCRDKRPRQFLHGRGTWSSVEYL